MIPALKVKKIVMHSSIYSRIKKNHWTDPLILHVFIRVTNLWIFKHCQKENTHLSFPDSIHSATLKGLRHFSLTRHMDMFRKTQKQQVGNKWWISLNKGTVPVFRSPLEMETMVSCTQALQLQRNLQWNWQMEPMSPPQCEIYLPHILLMPRLHSGLSPSWKGSAEPTPPPLHGRQHLVPSNVFCGVTAICKIGWGLGGPGHSPAQTLVLLLTAISSYGPGEGRCANLMGWPHSHLDPGKPSIPVIFLALPLQLWGSPRGHLGFPVLHR